MKRAVLIAVAMLGCARRADDLQLVDVVREDLVLAVATTGELAAVDSSDIKPPALSDIWDFKISWLAPEGSDVKRGDHIVTFDPDELNRSREALQTSAEEAQKRLEKKREEATLASRLDELKLLEADAAARKATLKSDVPADLVAALDLRSQQLDRELATMGLEQQKSAAAYARRSDAAEIQSLIDIRAGIARRLAAIDANLAQMTIASPRTGTVVYVMNYDGEKRKVGTEVYRSNAAVQIVGLGAMIGNGEVDEVDVARIAVHQPVTLRLDALPDTALHGRIESIATSVQARSGSDPSKVVRLVIAVEPAKAPLRPGMRFRGQIETQRIPNVVQVPADAVFISTDGPVAYRETSGGIEQVRLTLGRRSSDTIEVTSGLAAGDRVSRVDPGGP